MFPRAKTDKALHCENPTTSKTEEPLDQMTIFKEVEAIKTTDNMLEKKTDQEEEQNMQNMRKNSNSNKKISVILKALDNKFKEIITCRALPIMTREDHTRGKRDKNREQAIHHSEMTDREASLEARRVSSSLLEPMIYFHVQLHRYINLIIN